MKRLAAVCTLVLLASAAWATTEKVVYNFTGTNGDGANPWSNYFITDGKGNLYSTPGGGGTYQAGTVFMLSPKGKETILYEFKGQANGDGAYPHGRLAFDGKGNIFGSTQGGGTNGTGTVFELSPVRGGGWTEKVIYTFSAGGQDGSAPSAGMTFGSDGTMYSTTPDGGAYGAGTVFSLKQTAKGWKQKVIHSFNFSGGDGEFPYEGLMMDATGTLYGAAPSGGAVGPGAIYRLRHTTKGWVEDIIYSFTGTNGDGSGLYWIDLIGDTAGNIYGATSFGGTNGSGTVFELVYNKSKKTYKEKVLYEFGAQGGGDGNYPYGGLAMDGNGNLYGTTESGGTTNNGVVYKVAKSGSKWKYSILHNFAGGTSDGGDISGNIFLNTDGKLYGMAELGGTANVGVVFRVNP